MSTPLTFTDCTVHPSLSANEFRYSRFSVCSAYLHIEHHIATLTRCRNNNYSWDRFIINILEPKWARIILFEKEGSKNYFSNPRRRLENQVEMDPKRPRDEMQTILFWLKIGISAEFLWIWQWISAGFLWIWQWNFRTVHNIKQKIYIFYRSRVSFGARGSVVVKALCCKPEGRGFKSQLVDFLNWPNPSGRTGPGVDSASTRNEYQESLKIKKPGGKVRPARRADNLVAIY
jgi:hypothetical protein